MYIILIAFIENTILHSSQKPIKPMIVDLPLLRSGLFLAGVILCTTLSWAQKPSDLRDFEVKLESSDRSAYTSSMRINEGSNRPRTLYGLEYTSKTSTGDPVAIALEFLLANESLLGIGATSVNALENYFVRNSQAGTTVRFHQFWKGIPVYKSDIAVTISPEEQVSFVTNDFSYFAEIPDVNPSITEQEALQEFRSRLRVASLPLETDIELVIFEHNRQADVYYKIEANLMDPLGYWVALINARSGQVIKLEDEAIYYKDHKEALEHMEHEHSLMPPVDGMGNVFDPDPLSSANAAYTDTGFGDGGDATTPQLDAELQMKVLKDITFDGASTYSLVGPYAQIVDTELPNKGLFSQSSSTWNFNRNDDAFEAVNTYYHIDASMRYINEVLNLNIMPIAHSGGVRFDPHGLNGGDNSHYIGSTNIVAFGEGGVDDAEDSDVIHHELGHGLHDWVTGGNLSQTEGLSEGSGDYWCASYNRSLGNWQPSDPAYNWVFNWDGHNNFWNGRIVNYGAAYPAGLGNGIHADGQIWATAMMKIWDAIGQAKSDVAFWNGLGMTGGTASQNDAANAVYQAAINMNYPYSDLESIHNIFTATGYTLPALPTAPNDECTDAIALTVNADGVCASIIAGALAGATASGGDIASCGGEEDDDVWFSFVATADQHCLSLSNIESATSSLYWSIWTGTCGSLTHYACGDDASSETLVFSIGTTYYVRVYSFATGMESTTFDICVSTCEGAPVPCLENDITLSDQFLPDGTYQAINSVQNTSNVTVLPASAVNLFAGSFIELNPLFTAEQGAVLSLDIIPCVPAKE